MEKKLYICSEFVKTEEIKSKYQSFMKRKFYLLCASVLLSMAAWAGTVITCQQAQEYALSVSGNNVLYNDGAEYTVYGYVTAIQTAWSSTHSNVSFWVADTENGGKVIQAYRCVAATAADAPNVGAYVEVTGTLTKYGTTPEFSAGCTCTIISASADPQNLGQKTISEFKSMKNPKDTCVLTGLVTNILNSTYGNFWMTDLYDSLYVYGLLTPDGQTRQFASMDIAVGDEVTLKAVYAEYNNSPQATNAISAVGLRHLSLFAECLPEHDARYYRWFQQLVGRYPLDKNNRY